MKPYTGIQPIKTPKTHGGSIDQLPPELARILTMDLPPKHPRVKHRKIMDPLTEAES